MRSGTGYPAGGTQVLNPTIAHNLIENNSSYGLNLLTVIHQYIVNHEKHLNNHITINTS
jgi:hypothetical protein